MEQRPSPMTRMAPIDPRHWRRGLAKAVRPPVRAVLRYRPSPIVGALLLGAIVGGGLTAITVGVIADHSPTDQAVISQSLTGLHRTRRTSRTGTADLGTGSATITGCAG